MPADIYPSWYMSSRRTHDFRGTNGFIHQIALVKTEIDRIGGSSLLLWKDFRSEIGNAKRLGQNVACKIWRAANGRDAAESLKHYLLITNHHEIHLCDCAALYPYGRESNSGLQKNG